MTKLRHILVGILVFAVSTLWVKERWALSCLEAGIFLSSAWVLLRVALHRQAAPRGSVLPLILAGMCLSGVVQVAARWTVVESATREAVLYWLAAACLVWLGQVGCATREERLRFLKAALAAGFIIGVLGLIQLFTSDGLVFWLFRSGYDSEVIGPFVSRNNYAAFVELLLPVSLALVFQDRRNSRGYLVVAAVLAASVIASGSRAGTVIVIAESAFAFLLLRRADKEAVGRRWVTYAVLATAFTLIVGYQYLWERFSDGKDPYEVRREFVESSLAMVRAEPLHGFGFGTWPSAYKAFAVIDTGSVANHAHNEWVQWAAEGGIPAAAAMLAVMALCLPAAFRSIWGLGIIAVFLHAVVDYPFVRLGLAAWIYVFMGALAGFDRERLRLGRGHAAPLRWRGLAARGLAAASVPALAFGVYQSLKVGWADTLYHQATADSVARAARLSPNRAEYHLALAQTDPRHAVRHLNRAIALNPFLTTARIELALLMEAGGDRAGSEAALLEAARRDRQYAPAWALANFYFRTRQPNQFWRWARTSAWISYGGLRPLFDLCFLLEDDAQTVLERVVVPRRIVEREYLEYLVGQGRLIDARSTALRIAATASGDDRDLLLDYTDRALKARCFEAALDTWNALCARRLVPYPAAQPGTLANADFSQPILNRAFDWRSAPEGCAVVAQTRNDGPAIEAYFTGKQPESCEVLDHFVPLSRGARYVLRFQYRTADLPEATGLRWSVGTGRDYEFPASEEWSNGEWSLPPAADMARLVMAYRRVPGTRRTEGTILVRRVRLEEERNPQCCRSPDDRL